MSGNMVKTVSDILYKTDPGGCMSTQKDEYLTEAKIIVDVIKDQGNISLKELEAIFDVRFSGYYDILSLEEAHTDIDDLTH